LRHRLGAATPLGRRGLLRAMAPPVLAAAALISVNLVGFGRASLSPFGNVFLLARVVYDGPGMDVLRRDCPRAGWCLCRLLDEFPPTSDEFLWRADGPVVRAGGAKLVSADANAIIAAALLAEPGTELRAFLANTLHQLTRFASGDGLQPWHRTVTPWIERDFPRAELAAYKAARQTQGTLVIPARMQALHNAVSCAGVAGCCLLLPIALRRRHIAAGFAVAVLLTLLANAAITGGLSTPHDRYQSRIIWLPPLSALLATAALSPLARFPPARR